MAIYADMYVCTSSVLPLLMAHNNNVYVIIAVDADGKRVSDAFHDVHQQLVQVQANQTQVEKQLEQLASRLDLISRDLGLVNGSAQELRRNIVDAVNNQLPRHLAHLNGSVHEIRSNVSMLIRYDESLPIAVSPLPPLYRSPPLLAVFGRLSLTVSVPRRCRWPIWSVSWRLFAWS